LEADLAAGKKILKENPAGIPVTHACLIWGGSAELRLDAAWALAAAMTCSSKTDKPCLRCRDCRKIAAGLHPDITVVSRDADKQSVTVDKIRRISTDAVILPNEAERKVYILPQADLMNRQAQNAFLKLLEEPPSRVCFILAGENAGAFLQTVRSRCTQIRLTGENPIGDEYEKQAGRIIKAYISEDAADLLLTAMPAEKFSREQMSLLLSALWRAAAQELGKGGESPLWQAVGLIEKLMDMNRANVGCGQIAGLLCSGLIEEMRK